LFVTNLFKNVILSSQFVLCEEFDAPFKCWRRFNRTSRFAWRVSRLRRRRLIELTQFL